MKPQSRLLFDHEIIVDLFAGGGGLSIACEAALGRSPDIAINHNDDALSMLTPRELYRAQGFPHDYQIDVGHDGRRFTKSAQVRMVGNSVSPPPAAAIIGANCGDLLIEAKRRKA